MAVNLGFAGAADKLLDTGKFWPGSGFLVSISSPRILYICLVRNHKKRTEIDIGIPQQKDKL